MRAFLSLIIAGLIILPLAGHAYSTSEVTKIGSFSTQANINGIIWFKKKDGTNFSGCGQTAMYMPSAVYDTTNPTPFTPTIEGLESAAASIFLAKGMDLDVRVWYHVGSDGTCRYEIITVE